MLVQDRAGSRRFIAADPFSAANLFDHVTITRWRKAYVDGKCFLTDTGFRVNDVPGSAAN